MTDQKKRRIGFVLALFLLLSIALPAAADQPPRLPSAFYGTVKMNGANVPNGTLVSAWINGVKYAETTTFMTTINGQQVSVYTITVPGDDPSTPGIEGGNEGDTVVFRVGTDLADQTGTWHEGTDVALNLTVNCSPTAVSVSPSGYNSMPDYWRSFQAIYEDANGWADLRNVYLMWNTTAADNIQQFRYDVLNRKLYVRNDANTDWVGGFAPGAAVQLSNTNVTLDVSQTTVVTTTTQVRVTWTIMPKQPATAVNWKVYLKAVDSLSQSTGWVNLGTWRVNMFPNVGGLTPASGTVAVGTPQTFTATYSDEDGASTLKTAYIRFTMQPSPYTEQFRAYYQVSTNRVYVYNGSSWIGGLVIGSPGTIETAYAILDVGASSVSQSAKVLTVNWSITFKPGTQGAKDVWGYVYDNQNFQDGWVLIGQWVIGSGSAASVVREGAPPEGDAPIPLDAGPDFRPVFRTPDVYPGLPSPGFVNPERGDPRMGKSMMPDAEIQDTPAAKPATQRAPSPSGMPVVGTFAPAQSNVAPGWGWNFRAQVSDPSGYAHLSQVYVLFSLDGSTRNAIYIRYDQNTNRVYLRDSDDTVWLGGYVPGTNVKISSRNGTLDVSKTTIKTYSSNYLDVYPEIIFKSTGASQHYRIFVAATDDSNNDTGLVEKGWRRVNMWPGTGGATPSSNTQAVGTTYSYATTYTDSEQWSDFKYAFLNIASAPGATSQSLYAYYQVSTNQIRIKDDSGAWIGPITPGSAQDLQNSWVIVHGEGCSVAKNQDMLTVTWSIEFKAPMAGTTKNIYLYAQDRYDWIDPWKYAGSIQITP
ncbi:MAG: hypothetical protein QHH80_05315 [Anaerolineae bacterium]|nr:hypothetical protein [Anaerolineae bacterium]